LRGIDEPERVFEVAIEGLEVAEGTPSAEAPAPPAPSPSPAAAGEKDEKDLGQDISRRFEDLGTRLAAGIQEKVLRSLGGRTSETPSAVDDIAARMASLGDEIDERVREALAKKGIPPAES
jgi:hypothetical protein